jgi:PKD repeat protein
MMKRLSNLFFYAMAAGLLTFAACSEDEDVKPPVVAPTASFTFEADKSNPLIVSFTNNSTDVEASEWDFGDGTKSTDHKPTHTYTEGGTYTVKLTVVNSAGTDQESKEIVVVDLITGNLPGEWILSPQAGALAVGPTAGSAEWWFNSETDQVTRACLFDDVFTFGEGGSFSIAMDGETWLETWQGVGSEQCGTPVAPHDGSGSYTWELIDGKLKLAGKGAFVGLAKAVNAGELPNVAVPDDVTYMIDEFSVTDGSKKMKLIIETGTGVFWTFILVSK